MGFSRILVAVDFTPHSERLYDIAREIAEKFDAGIDVVHVVHDLAHYTGIYITQTPIAEVQREMERDAARRMEEFKARCPFLRPDAEFHVLTGNPQNELMKFIHTSRADLVVIGTHSLKKPEHRLIGSTAEHIVRSARIPVLSVHINE
jgi:nucleotide-binding universal stress UspA family protein